MAQGKFKKTQVKSSKGTENVKTKSIHRVIKQQEKSSVRHKTSQKNNSIQKIVNANLERGMKKNIEKDLHSQAKQHEGKSFNILSGKN